jgi:phage protein D
VRRPTIDVTLGTASADDWTAALVGLRVQCAPAPEVDVAELYVARTAGAPSAALGDSGSIGLGYADSGNEVVFTGQVVAVQHRAQGPTRVVLANGGAALAALRVNQSYEQQTAGDIVGDLAGRVGATTGTVDSGASFPFYVVDDRQTGYHHVATLARLCGFLAYVATDGSLMFGAPVGGAPVQQFAYAVDVLSIEFTAASPLVGGVSVIGEGAAGSQGTDAWAWFIKDPAAVTGTAGSGPPERLVERAAARSSDAASMAASSASQAFARADTTGRLLVPGAPAVAVGSSIAIVDAPQAELNGSGLVLGVRHRYSRDSGFTSHITFSRPA